MLNTATNVTNVFLNQSKCITPNAAQMIFGEQSITASEAAHILKLLLNHLVILNSEDDTVLFLKLYIAS